MPKISVILPVYNAEKYLKEAIDSILIQTFTDFELLIINDGSTDDSEKIIQGYRDDRIVSISNQTNKGLIYSLNRAIDLSKGEFIARMDADDISLPERFEKQVFFLEQNSADILATRVKLIDEKGRLMADWNDDIKNITAKEIKQFLLVDNCIAHPTVFGKTELFKKYRYRTIQKYSEDYDLWLRLTADGVGIYKIEEPLLFYRVLPNSLTRQKKINIFLRLAKVKFRFVSYQVGKGKINTYVLLALLYAGFDLVKALGKELKLLLNK